MEVLVSHNSVLDSLVTLHFLLCICYLHCYAQQENSTSNTLIAQINQYRNSSFWIFFFFFKYNLEYLWQVLITKVYSLHLCSRYVNNCMRWRRSAGRTYAGFFSDNLPATEIVYSRTSKSCKDSNILIFIRWNKMEFQDLMEEYIFHIILLQQYECSLYFTIGERRSYQQKKKKKKGYMM